MQRYTVYFIWKLLYRFRLVPLPIIRSAASGICHAVIAICRYRGRVGTRLSVLWVAYATHSTKPETCRAVSDKINCVTFHLVGYILEYYYDARIY